MRLRDDEDVVVCQIAAERQRCVEKDAYRCKQGVEPSPSLLRQWPRWWPRSHRRLHHAVVVDRAWEDESEYQWPEWFDALVMVRLVSLVFPRLWNGG